MPNPLERLQNLGPLAELLAQPDVTDILINGSDGVWVDDGNRLRRTAVALGDAESIRVLAVRLTALAGKRLDDAEPMVDASIPGLRIHAVLPPVAPGGPLVSLRVIRRVSFSLEQLRDRGMIGDTGIHLLNRLVDHHANVLISGATGSGKTTLLSTLLSLVDTGERIICVEEAQELNPRHPHVIFLETRRPNAEGRGGTTLTQLIRESLRMRPDRIVLGECRGAEVREVLMALNTGHAGSAATIHANSPSDVPARLEALGSLAGSTGRALALQAAAAFDVVVHVVRDRRTGLRRLAEIAALDHSGGNLRVNPAISWWARPERGPAWDELKDRFGW